MTVLITFMKVVVNFVYILLKLFPTKNKITFISRQSNEIPINFLLLKKEFNEEQLVFLSKKIEEGAINKLKYLGHLLIQMYHIATSKIIILDSYCITVSILKHKKNLKVIQMWHAMGSIKKFGYSILDKKEGNSSKIVKLMRMHKNYDYIFASSDFAITNLKKAFQSNESKYIKLPLPIVDMLLNKEFIKTSREKISNIYPQTKEKINILYAPTFRKGGVSEKAINNLISLINFNKYNLIIKVHHLSKEKLKSGLVIIDNDFITQEWLAISDYVITDYSALILEAGVMKKKVFLYCYDFDKYNENRGFYFDYKKELKGISYRNAKKVVSQIENSNYNYKTINNFTNKMIDIDLDNASFKIGQLIKNIK